MVECMSVGTITGEPITEPTPNRNEGYSLHAFRLVRESCRRGLVSQRWNRTLSTDGRVADHRQGH
jgi:hypothetical protein